MSDQKITFAQRLVEAGEVTRPLHEIAREITRTWKNVNYAARPYLDAMRSLNTVDDNYGYDDGRGIVLYFLSNARTWRGEDAKRIKAELKSILASR